MADLHAHAAESQTFLHTTRAADEEVVLELCIQHTHRNVRHVSELFMICQQHGQAGNKQSTFQLHWLRLMHG